MKSIFRLTFLTITIFTASLFADEDFPTVTLKVSGELAKSTLEFWNQQKLKGKKVDELAETVKEVSKRGEFDMFEKREWTAGELLYLISVTPRGRKLLVSLLPLIASDTVKIKDVSEIPKAELPTLAFAGVYYLDVKTIYLKLKHDLYHLLPILVHEGTHAVDAELEANVKLWAEVRKLTGAITVAKKRYESLKGYDEEVIQALLKARTDFNAFFPKMADELFTAEHRAYRAQGIFAKDLDAIVTHSKGRKFSDLKGGYQQPEDWSDFEYTMQRAAIGEKTVDGHKYVITLESLREYLKKHEWEDYD